MVAKIRTKVLLLSLLLTLATKAAAQETTATPATTTTTAATKPEVAKSASEKDKTPPKVNEKENVILKPSLIDGFFQPSFGPLNYFPKPEVTYYALKPKRHEPLNYYPGPYYVKTRPYNYNNPYPHYRPHEGRYRGIDQGYRNHQQHGQWPQYRKPWGSFPHYEVQHQQFGHRPSNYPYFSGYNNEFYERSRPRLYHGPLDFHTFQNYELIRVHHSDSYEERHDEKTSATASPKISTEKPKEEMKDTILLIPETKDTKLEEEVTTATTTTTTTTEETKTVVA